VFSERASGLREGDLEIRIVKGGDSELENKRRSGKKGFSRRKFLEGVLGFRETVKRKEGEIGVTRCIPLGRSFGRGGFITLEGKFTNRIQDERKWRKESISEGRCRKSVFENERLRFEGRE